MEAGGGSEPGPSGRGSGAPTRKVSICGHNFMCCWQNESPDDCSPDGRPTVARQIASPACTVLSDAAAGPSPADHFGNKRSTCSVRARVAVSVGGPQCGPYAQRGSGRFDTPSTKSIGGPCMRRCVCLHRRQIHAYFTHATPQFVPNVPGRRKKVEGESGPTAAEAAEAAEAFRDLIKQVRRVCCLLCRPVTNQVQEVRDSSVGA